MKVIGRVKNVGLTSNQIKWIALFFMTVDHLSAFGFEIPIISANKMILRLLGRIAIPLFLYMLIESARHTRSKPTFILRLYISGMLVGLFVALTNFFFGNMIGIFSPGNIIFTFFYTVLYIYIIENILIAWKDKNYKRLTIFIFAFVATYIPHIFLKALYSLYNHVYSQLKPGYNFLMGDLIRSFVPSPFYVEYSFIFVFLGVILYFAKRKVLQCAIYAVFCVLCYGISVLQRSSSFFIPLFEYPQYWMILALPIMLFYNGKRGKARKMFFYIYYPVHRYVVSIIQTLLT